MQIWSNLGDRVVGKEALQDHIDCCGGVAILWRRRKRLVYFSVVIECWIRRLQFRVLVMRRSLSTHSLFFEYQHLLSIAQSESQISLRQVRCGENSCYSRALYFLLLYFQYQCALGDNDSI